MQKKYFKPYEKDLLEEILNRNRRMLSKRALQNSSKVKKTTDRTNKSGNTGGINTIFKSIGHRKNCDSLKTALEYVLKNAPVLENEMGEILYLDNVANEISRFDLIPDELNLKDPKKPISEENLKSRQMWHAMFSLPNKEVDIEDFKSAIREVLSEEFIGHKFAFGIHTNTDNPHAHFIIKEKNDLTKKKLRIGTKELYHLNERFQDACIKYGISVDKNQDNLVEIDVENKKKDKKEKKKKKLADCYYKNSPKFVKMYYSDSFQQLETNQGTLNKLKKLGMNDENINKFLNLYAENKRLAMWAIDENHFLFNIKKPKERVNLRQVKINGKSHSSNSNKGVQR